MGRDGEMMKQAFTIIELMIVIAIFALTAGVAITAMMDGRLRAGDTVHIPHTTLTGVIVGHAPYANSVFIVRIDNGPAVVPRFTETRFTYAELMEIEK